MTKPTRFADETVAARETSTVSGAVEEGCAFASMTSQIVWEGLIGKINQDATSGFWDAMVNEASSGDSRC